MLMQAPTPEMVQEWKNVWNKYKDALQPNRKYGQEIVDYLFSKYILTEIYSERASKAVFNNVIKNKPNAEKLPPNTKPKPKTFYIENQGNGQVLFEKQDEIFKGDKIFVGVDIESGYYCIEGSSMLWDELCAFQGVDEKDIQNAYCVAQYIACLKKFDKLQDILDE